VKIAVTISRTVTVRAGAHCNRRESGKSNNSYLLFPDLLSASLSQWTYSKTVSPYS
jgi:hypothetical protein